MYIKKSLIVTVSILGIVGCGTTSTSTETGITTSPTDTLISIEPTNQQAYLDAINNARATGRSCGIYGFKSAVPALIWNDNLYKASIEHSRDMADSNTFSHTGSNTSSDLSAQVLSLGSGSSLKDRITYNQYTNWTNLGENIAAGQNDLDATMTQWITSDGHCINIMNPNFTEVGMSHAVSSSSQYYDYWTQTFGAR